MKKERNKLSNTFEIKHACNGINREINFLLLDYLNCAFRTLGFACPANKTLVNINWDGFAVFDLIDAYWTSVYAGFASVAPIIIDYYFYHVRYLW